MAISMSPVQILLIEDENSIRTALTRAFERDGHRVSAAASLAEARALIAVQAPELVVSDLKLPDGDGLDLVGQLGVPVIMLSGYATYDDAVRALRCGAVDFFTKPVAIKDVRAALARVRPGQRLAQVPVWSDPEGALAVVRELVARLPGRLARLAASELVQAAPAGRLLVQADQRGVRMWLDGQVDWSAMAQRRTWLEAHGIVLVAAEQATVAVVSTEPSTAYDDVSERLWSETLEVGQTIHASAWRVVGSWLLSAARAGAGPFAGLDPSLCERLGACGVSVRTAPATLGESGVGSAERAGLLADDDLGAPIA
jgi:DNA-binding response OmpR family regulator